MNYSRIYQTIISNGQHRLPFKNCHRHRILPGHLGGEYTSENICYLTRQEHRIIHAIRYKLYNNKADAIACQALGGKNPGGYNLSKTTRDNISKGMKGKPSWNKGIPNLVAKERMLKNNPMKDPLIAAKCSNSKKGKPAHNRGPMVSFQCEWCKSTVTQPKSKLADRSRFCGRSCAAKFRSNRTAPRHAS